MCSSLIQWVMKKDSKGNIKFAALQDEKIENLIKKTPQHIQHSDSVILYSKGEFYHHSTAVLKLYGILGFPWSILKVFLLIPTFIRDAIYKFIARNRKKWFGRSDSCYMVPVEKRSRFITDPTYKYD